MNLGSLLADLYRRFDYTSLPVAPAITARLTAFLNEAHRELLTTPGLEHLRDDVIAVTAYSGIARTGLPASIARIHAITDRVNGITLEQVPLHVLRMTDPQQAFTGGYPWRYAFIGNQAVYRQPGGSTPAASGLWAASSSASDISQKVYVESIVTGGTPAQPTSAGTTLTGTSRVQIGTLTSHLDVTKFYLDNPCAGAISLYDAAAAGNELAVIPIGQTASRYAAVEWFPIVTADTTEYVDYERQIFDLVNLSDEPLLPPDFHPLVGIGARVREYESIDDSRLANTRVLYEQGKTALKSFVMNTGDRIASLRPARMGWNRLGAQYENQRWPG